MEYFAGWKDQIFKWRVEILSPIHGWVIAPHRFDGTYQAQEYIDIVKIPHTFYRIMHHSIPLNTPYLYSAKGRNTVA